MASVRDYIKIDPTEKRNKALGVIFPFNAEAVFYSSYTTKEQVKSNLLNVLLTEPGERILKPNFGVGLRNYLFENTSNIESLQNRINEQINTYIRGIELVNVDVIKNPDSHQLNVIVTYRVLANQTLENIQVNFTQDSGVSAGTGGAASAQVGSNTVSSGTGGVSGGGGSSGGGGGVY